MEGATVNPSRPAADVEDTENKMKVAAPATTARRKRRWNMLRCVRGRAVEKPLGMQCEGTNGAPEPDLYLSGGCSEHPQCSGA